MLSGNHLIYLLQFTGNFFAYCIYIPLNNTKGCYWFKKKSEGF